MDLVKVDVVGVQPPEAVFDLDLDSLRFEANVGVLAVKMEMERAPLAFPPDAAFRRDDHLVAPAGDRFRDNFFAVSPAISGRRVEESDAQCRATPESRVPTRCRPRRPSIPRRPSPTSPTPLSMPRFLSSPVLCIPWSSLPSQPGFLFDRQRAYLAMVCHPGRALPVRHVRFPVGAFPCGLSSTLTDRPVCFRETRVIEHYYHYSGDMKIDVLRLLLIIIHMRISGIYPCFAIGIRPCLCR